MQSRGIHQKPGHRLRKEKMVCSSILFYGNWREVWQKRGPGCSALDLQRGIVSLAKSVRKERMEENITFSILNSALKICCKLPPWIRNQRVLLSPRSRNGGMADWPKLDV